MPKQPSLPQRNLAAKEELLKQSVSISTGFLRNDLKEFIVDEMINAANNHKVLLTGRESVQDRYNKFKTYYEKLFTEGLKGHAQFTGQLEKKARADMNKRNMEYYIVERGIEKKVSHAELSYKMELLQHKLSTAHDVAFTKFVPKYFVTGKGNYRVVITIPDLNDIDMEDATTEEIVDFFYDNGVEIIISDPNKLKNEEARKKAAEAKKKQQTRVKEAKEKFYDLWQREKKKR